MTVEENRECLLKAPKGWEEFFQQLEQDQDFLALVDKVAEEASSKRVYPPLDHVYQALEKTSPSSVKVVILGQDPYFHEGQANGMAFSVGKGMKLPPSLINIYKELSYEYGYPIPKETGDLSRWAEQGVLLLNASLTVRDGEPNSHADYGWDKVTVLAENHGLTSELKTLVINDIAGCAVRDGAKRINSICAKPENRKLFAAVSALSAAAALALVFGTGGNQNGHSGR